MEDQLAELMRILAEEAKAYKPLLADTFRVFQETKNTAAQKNPSGGATKEARQARQKVLNPLLNATHYLKAKAVAAVHVKETGKDFGKAIEKAVHAYVLHQQSCLVYDLHRDPESSVYKSRQASADDTKTGVARLVEILRRYGVTTDMLNRLSEWQIAFFARCVLDAVEDPKFLRPDNQLRLLFENGFLDCFRGEMSDHEAQALAEVSTFLDDPEAMALNDKFNEKWGPLDLTAGFKASAQRLMQNAAGLSDGEARALFDARGRRYSANTEMLGKLLGLSADEQMKVDAFVRILEDPTLTTEGGARDVNRRLIVSSLLLRFEECDQRNEHPAEWLPSVVQTLMQEDGFIARNVPNEAAFWSLAFLALELSTFRDRDEIRFLRQRATADEATRQALADFYQRNGMPHHTDNDGVPWLGEALPPHDQPDRPQDDECAHEPSQPRHRAPSSTYVEDDILEAEFDPVDTDIPRDLSDQGAIITTDERNPAPRSSTSNHRFEEFE